MNIEAVKWIGGTDGVLELIDQRRLPGEFVKLKVRSVEQLHEAIRTLTVRGRRPSAWRPPMAPFWLLQWLTGRPSSARRPWTKCSKPATIWPPPAPPPSTCSGPWTASAPRRARSAEEPQATVSRLHQAILTEANAIYQEDVEMCRRIGENGERLIRDGFGVLTHCNAGALATAGQGTALSVFYEAQKRGRRFEVYADETRPLLQGSRLTAWELQQAGIKVTVICDNMAGSLMKQGKIQAVITGADRIAANGDTANKIGTYSVAVLAKHHGIPFYIAAPSSTFDLSIESGAEIPIEQRNPDEVTRCAGVQTAPNGVAVYNPAFDVTDAKHITAIITEKGVIENPNTERIRGAAYLT